MSDNPKPLKTEVGAVVNAIKILRYLASSSKSEGVTAIARATSISPSTTFNILRTLESQEMVSMDEQSKTYQLGIGLAELVSGLISMSPFQLIQPELDKISNETGGQAVLWRNKDGNWVAVASGKMSSPVRIETGTGVSIPLYSGAIGKMTISLQNLDNEKLMSIYKETDFECQPEFSEYKSSILSASVNGWALDINNTFKGVAGVSSVILDKEKPALGISLVFVSSRLDNKKVKSYGEMVSQLCKKLSAILYSRK